MTNDILIRAEHLSHYYGPNHAVDDISFEVKRGEVLGFLGPNGAGKSTSMQMLTGNLSPTMGRIHINGYDILDKPKQAKAELGYLPETPPVYKELTVYEYLQYCARLNRITSGKQQTAIKTAIDRCSLGEVKHRLIGNLSKGYQQRVGIAQAIIHSPAVVILDEPTVGLDPKQIREIRELIRELGGDHSVILSTHILPEVQTTCDRVQIINRGKLVLNESITDLNNQMQSENLIFAFKAPPGLAALNSISGVIDVDIINDQRFRIHIDPDNDPTDKIVKLSTSQDWGLYELSPERKTLEEIFMEITSTEHHYEHTGMNTHNESPNKLAPQSEPDDRDSSS